ncbi:MAG: hypothetical protein WA921_10785 [Ahrensia sp.]
MAQRGKQGGRSTTRKPVTIDLEATPQNPTDEIPADAVNAANDEQVSQGESQPAAEPVAMEALKADAATTDTVAAATDDAASNDADPADESASQAPNTDEPTVAASAAAAGATTIVQKRGVSAIGGGVVGALLALVGGAGLQSAGMLPSFGGGQAPVEQAAPPVDLTPLETQIAALQDALETVRAGGAEGGAGAGVSETVQAELASVSERLDALQQAVSSGQAGEGAGLEAIASRLSALEAQSAQQASAGEAGSGALDPAAALAAVQPALDTINEQVSTLSADINEQVSVLGSDVSAISQTLEGVTGEIATLQQGITTLTDNQAATGEQVSMLTEQLAANTERLEQSGAGNTVARAIAASGLKSAADRGLPFMAELETFASAGGDAEALASLRDFAAAGVPTRAQLVEQFAPVANAIVASQQNIGEDSSIADRLMNSARSLVQVRDLNEVEGESVTAITNRIDAALKADDLDTALAQWESLPDSAKAASAAFADQLRARQNVDSLLNDVLTQAMAATAPSADQ